MSIHNSLSIMSEERQRILSVLREFDLFLAREENNSRALQAASVFAGKPSDHHLYRALAMEEARSEFGKILAEVEEPEIVPV